MFITVYFYFVMSILFKFIYMYVFMFMFIYIYVYMSLYIYMYLIYVYIRWVKNFEVALTTVWDRHDSAQKPCHIQVPDILDYASLRDF